jgi:hypothetical protein
VSITIQRIKEICESSKSLDWDDPKAIASTVTIEEVEGYRSKFAVTWQAKDGGIRVYGAVAGEFYAHPIMTKQKAAIVAAFLREDA